MRKWYFKKKPSFLNPLIVTKIVIPIIRSATKGIFWIIWTQNYAKNRDIYKSKTIP
jgi:hypothetical protein